MFFNTSASALLSCSLRDIHDHRIKSMKDQIRDHSDPDISGS